MKTKELKASFSRDEWEEVKAWLEENDWTQYRLVKEAVLEKVRNKAQNPGPLDEFLEETP